VAARTCSKPPSESSRRNRHYAYWCVHRVGADQQKGGKIVHAWAFDGDCDPNAIGSNTFTTKWPPKSGRQMEFPEIDRADFFDMGAAKRKIKAGQEALIDPEAITAATCMFISVGRHGFQSPVQPGCAWCPSTKINERSPRHPRPRTRSGKKATSTLSPEGARLWVEGEWKRTEARGRTLHRLGPTVQCGFRSVVHAAPWPVRRPTLPTFDRLRCWSPSCMSDSCQSDPQNPLETWVFRRPSEMSDVGRDSKAV